MSYGKVIDGGAAMRKGVSKGINSKVASREKEYSRRDSVAAQVVDAYKVRNLSNQAINNVRDGDKFKKGTVPSKV
jgi:hypothetical protein